ncbi:MAG: transposase [Methylibium sp.]|nr:transposase [Methylibium sp.]MBA3599103.1 transposase [Methylibium sp.]
MSDGRRRRRTHSAEFKAQVIAACRQPGVSIAAVAMANGVNANLARRWVVAAEQGATGGDRLVAVVSGVAQTPAFVPVQLACASPTPDIRIELRRGATAITVHWPSAEAAQCAAWMRELLR